MKKLSLLFASIIIGFIIQAQVSLTLHLNTAGTLSTLLTAKQKDSVTNLTLTGSIDVRDFFTMRDKMPKIEVINLSNAIILAKNGIFNGNMPYDTDTVYLANTIPQYAFGYTTATPGIEWYKPLLKSIFLPKNITSIDRNAFEGCIGLLSITIPSTVTKLGSYAFNLCKGLKSIYSYSKTAIDLSQSQSVFRGRDIVRRIDTTNCILYVPFGSKTTYDTANQWKAFTHIVEISDSTLLFSKTEIIIADTATITSVGIKSSLVWTATSNELWLTVSNNQTVNDTLYITALTNNGNTLRSATITITTTDGNIKTINITQVAKKDSNSVYSSEVSESVLLFPNPAKTNISITANNKQLFQNATVSIITINGTQVLQQTLNNEKTSIDVSTLSAGLYFVKVWNGSFCWVGRFLKE